MRQEFEDLKTKFGQLEGVSRKLQSKASAPLEYGSELDDASKLYGPARQKKIDELSRKIAEDQQKVDELSTKPETKLKGLEGIETLPTLEARKAKAEKDAGLKDLRQHNPSGSPPVGQPHGNRSEGRS